MRSRGQNIILFYTHSNNKTNKYFFEIDNSQYRFMNDSIEYVPDLLKLKNERGGELYKQELISMAKVLLAKMDDFGIRDISSEMAGAGIALKIYMKSKGVVLYVPNPQKVPSQRFNDYINSMQKLDENWYYTMKE
jgi:Mor family transcriptional regulator